LRQECVVAGVFVEQSVDYFPKVMEGGSSMMHATAITMFAISLQLELYFLSAA